MPKQYTFTSGVLCARGLQQFASLQQYYHLHFEKYKTTAEILKQGILKHMICENKYIKGNINDQQKTDPE